jgi:hypothetical protein
LTAFERAIPDHEEEEAAFGRGAYGIGKLRERDTGETDVRDNRHDVEEERRRKCTKIVTTTVVITDTFAVFGATVCFLFFLSTIMWQEFANELLIGNTSYFDLNLYCGCNGWLGIPF